MTRSPISPRQTLVLVYLTFLASLASLATIALLVAGALLSTGCPSSQTPVNEVTIKDVKTAAIDCATAGLQQTVVDLEPVVTTILTGHSVHWRPMLNGLAHSFSDDAIACTLHMLSQAPLPTTATRELHPATPPTTPSAQERARTFINERAWAFKGEGEGEGEDGAGEAEEGDAPGSP